MVTFLITSVLIIGLFAVALYFWQKPAKRPYAMELPPPAQTRGLFDDSPEPNQLPAGTNEKINRETVLARAVEGDKSALQDAHKLADLLFYTSVLNTLLDRADSSTGKLALISYVTRYELPVSDELAASLIEVWRATPDRDSIAKLVHIAALSDNARTYSNAVEVVMGLWREGKVPEVSPVELQALFQGEFWVLSSRTRSSGAGFILKRTLAFARKELETQN
jgi:hypothetical protein